MEVWKNIDGYSGDYEVSNKSRIRSNKGKKPIILKNIKNGSDYLQVCLYKKGVAKIHLLHRIVAIAFLPNPENKPQINHIDSNPSNSSLDNLEWTTQSENLLHAIRSGRKPTDKFEKPIIGTHIKTGEKIKFKSINEAGRNGFSAGNICSCIKGKKGYKTAKGYKWEYEKNI